MTQPEIEKQVLEFWRKQDIFQKSLDKPAPKGEYVFYDGPPFATGAPHYGHIVASLMKDMVPRYFTMRGFHVARRWGWDCHGLPIENIVEEELGFKHKKEIVAFGIDKFNEKARGKVLQYADEWRVVIERLGRWVDMDNAYRTMDRDFMESVWWAFKQLWDKGLIYEGFRSMHICPRCETTLSQSEVSEGYKEVEDLSVVVKFKVKNSHKLQIQYKSTNKNDVYFLAWTTTPWTLPGNAALAVGKDIDYVIFEKMAGDDDRISIGEKIIFAEGDIESRDNVTFFRIFTERDKGYYTENKKGRFESPSGEEYERKGSIKGEDLIGLEYEPLFPYYDNDGVANRQNGFKVYAADFVNTEEGTGIVHIAPAFGEDDRRLGEENNLPFIQHINMDGTFKEEVADFAGLTVKPIEDESATDKKIVAYLDKRGLLFSQELYRHSYPHCWRCESPLLNYSASSYFVAVTKIKEQLLSQAESIRWVPSHIKEGRFGNWLANARDWSISRQRFWGSVIPVWKCQSDTNKYELHTNDPNKKSPLLSEERVRARPALDAGVRSGEDGCNNIVVIGSVAELTKLSGHAYRQAGKKIADLHKHFVDKISFKCGQCGGTMRRIPDVLDCWFESGAMPYAQAHYPFENKESFECVNQGIPRPAGGGSRDERENDKTPSCRFPARFIAEGVDQTRAWFYYLHVLGVALFGKAAFQNAVANGIVLAEDGQKMSKRLSNYPDPMSLFDKYGADAVRYYLASSPVMSACDLNFSEKGVEEAVKKVLLTLYNVLAFYKMYPSDTNNTNKHTNNANDKKSVVNGPAFAKASAGRQKSNVFHILDRWIISKLNVLIRDITAAYEAYDLNRAVRPLGEFINELSTWFVRRSRSRFKGEDAKDKSAAIATLGFVLSELSKLMAPVMPFTAEHVYKEAGNWGIGELGNWSEGGESVHLEDWPKPGEIDEQLLAEMEKTRQLAEIIHSLRAKSGIKVRQPLAEAVINMELPPEFLQILKEEINVQLLTNSPIHQFTNLISQGWIVSEDNIVALNVGLTGELRLQGHLRELTRQINALRKKRGLTVGDKVAISYQTKSKELKTVFAQFTHELQRAVIASEIREQENEGEEMEVDGEKVKIKISN